MTRFLLHRGVMPVTFRDLRGDSVCCGKCSPVMMDKYYDGQTVSIDGKITEIELLDAGSLRYVIKVDFIDGRDFLIPFAAALYSRDERNAEWRSTHLHGNGELNRRGRSSAL